MSKRELKRDLLDEGAAGFEEAVFRKTVGAARRARRTRFACRTALAALFAAYLGFQYWPREQKVLLASPNAVEAPVQSHRVLRSEPFAGTIRTAEGSVARLTGENRVVVLKTSETEPGLLRAIDDEQLLSFFEGQAVALVGRGSGRAELVFLEEVHP